MHWFFAFLLFPCILAVPRDIRIVGIFDQYEETQVLAFRYAVERINRNKEILPGSTLNTTIIRIPADDSFHASKKVCQFIRSGVAAIFGPNSENTANHIQSICDTLQIPHIETRWKYKLTHDSYSVNLYPFPTSMSAAYYDVVKTLGWTSFAILYDSNASLIRLQKLLKSKKWKVSLRRPAGDDWRPLLKELKKNKVTKLVVDVEQEKVYDVLKQAQQIGLMRAYHSYFITSLDMNLVDVHEFGHGRPNITSLRLVDPTTEGIQKVIESLSYGDMMYPHHQFYPRLKSITTEAALIYDAVHLFARALDDLDKSKLVHIVPLYCDAGKTWPHGNSIINLMKWYGTNRFVNQSVPYPTMNAFSSLDSGPMTGIGHITPYQSNFMQNKSINFVPESNFYDRRSQFGDRRSRIYDELLIHGLSGFIKFNREGFRSDFELQITEFDHKKGDMIQVGRWTRSGKANYTRSYTDIADEMAMSLENQSIIVTSATSIPYVMIKNNSENLEGNDRYEGFCIDLMDMIKEVLKFNYTIKLAFENKYGSKDSVTGEYDGMIGELLNHRADLAIVDFTITSEREEVVDFSMPFMNLGIGIIFKKPQKQASSLFSFMNPFSTEVWIYMATAYLGTSVLMFILARIAPIEWDNPHPCIQDPDELENSITLSNAFWFTIGSLMQQGSDIAPKAVSTRIIASIWWSFTLIMIASYTANLAASLTVERMESPITGAEDLAKQSKIKYGCKDGGSTKAFFNASQLPIYKRMKQAMVEARPTVFMDSNEAGVDRVSDSKGTYAFLMESSSIEYNVERRCDLMQVGGLLDAKSYGIALPPGSPYTGAVSSAILRLKETGELQELKTKWWKERGGGGKCQTGVELDSGLELGLENVGGVFVVMVIGSIGAILVGCFEFFWKARKLVGEGERFTEELMKELKFVWSVGENTKPVRKPKESSIYESSTNFDYNKVDY